MFFYNTIKDVAQNAFSFLQTGVSPKNCPPKYKKIYEDQNHFKSKKFFIVFTASVFLAFFYFSSILILFFIPHLPEVVAGFVTMFSKTIEILAVIIAFYTTGQAAVDLKYNSSSNAEVIGEVVVEKREEILTHNTKEDDYDISEIEV
jgi:hypothetical protein